MDPRGRGGRPQPQEERRRRVGGITRSWIRVDAADVPNLKKCGGGLRSWIRVEAATASVQTLEVNKATMTRRSTRSAQQIQCVEVLLLNQLLQYAAGLQHRLLQCAEGDKIPFEFHALELALEAARSFLDD